MFSLTHLSHFNRYPQFNKMAEQTVYSLERQIIVELSITNVPLNLNLLELSNIANVHFKQFQCDEAWKPTIGFCLMWATVRIHPDRFVHSDTIIRRGRLISKLTRNVILKIRSEQPVNNYEYTYTSPIGQTYVHFKFKTEPCILHPLKIVDAFRATIPPELKNYPCKYFMKNYNLDWDKSEDPYILIMKENESNRLN